MKAKLLETWSIMCFFQISCQSFRPAIRVRLNRPVFDQASSIVQGLVEYEVPRVNIPSTRQCFQEGCVDVSVERRSIGVSALLDLQKTVNDQPYLRFNECKIENGIVSTRVANMGLLTDTINQKFGTVLSGQSRIQLEEAICEHMNRLTQQHFSTRLARIPRSLSAKELLEIIISNNVKKNPTSPATNFATLVRQKRATTTSDDYYDDIEKTEGRPAKPLPNVNLRKISLSRDDVINFFNIERLSHILIDLTLLDAASTSSDFSLGISGNVYSSRSREIFQRVIINREGTTPYSAPYPFKIPQNNNRRMVEVIVSQYSLNSLLFQAHRCIFFLEGTRQKIGVVPFNTVVQINMKTIAGKLKGMEVEDEIQKTKNVLGTVTIQSLDFVSGVDFLGMSVSDLDGLRRTTKAALQNFVSSTTADGFTLSTASMQ
ncbi:hypothetical protein CAEBREN_32105 [Caenorhabditis brenneri]|uniref:Lipid-binding serum glycoprotein C-terminal domain-containing protein n=1 Tax=Caenorhabditis brenneri TaxID=135651 RepID=G0PIZ2_CAEBE|nr:hypothetical protein CAEBREN_32105 [Caenorhabditis brenneri]